MQAALGRKRHHKDKYECDFVVKKGMDVVSAYQVCCELDENNEERENKRFEGCDEKIQS